MEALFLKLVNMSLTASWLVLAVLILRLVLKKAPRYIHCLLWGLVALRLIFPFSIESVISLIPSTEPLPEEFLYAATPQVNTGVPALNNAINPVIAESLTPVGLTSANPTQIWSFIFSRLWVIGVAVMLLYALVSFLLVRRKASAFIPVGKNIRLCDHIDTPFILGILHPKIYLPSSLDQQTADHVLAHEYAHLKRKDHWWKPVGFLLLSVYWFNPVMWLAYVLLCRDIEMACDEKVIRELNVEEKKAYSNALLACSVPRRMIAACPLAFGEVGVKDRIKSVLNYKKPAFWVIVVAVIACIAVAVCFLTNPKDPGEEAVIDSLEIIEDITSENGYQILNQNPVDIRISIPKSALPDSIYSEEGQTFAVNDVVVYETGTTRFYLDSVRFANEGDDWLYFKFNAIYTLPEAGTVTLLHSAEDEDVTQHQLWASHTSIMDRGKEYPYAVFFRGVDGITSFTVYVDTEVCKAASENLTFQVDNFTDLTYGPEGYDAVDAALLVEERLSSGSYVCSECVYWPPYSSNLRPNTGPYNFLVYEDSISFYSSSSGDVIDEHTVDWQWKPLAQCYEDAFFYIQWYEDFASVLGTDAPAPSAATLYQILGSGHMLIKTDGIVYMVDGTAKGRKAPLEYVDAIYRVGRIELTGSGSDSFSAAQDGFTMEIVEAEHHTNGVSLFVEVTYPRNVDWTDVAFPRSIALGYTSADGETTSVNSHAITVSEDEEARKVQYHFVFDLYESPPTDSHFTLTVQGLLESAPDESLILNWQADVDDAHTYSAKSGDSEATLTISPYVVNVEFTNSGYNTINGLYDSITIWGKDGTILPIRGPYGGGNGSRMTLSITLLEPVDIDNIRSVKVGGLTLE